MKRGIILLLTLLILTLPTILAPHIEESTSIPNVDSIALKAEGAQISWETSGHSEQGFKVIWSKTENPTYPTRSGDKYHYYTEPEKNSDTLEAFEGEGTYYVRVCEYLGGKCGIYSNQVKIQLESKTEEKEPTSLLEKYEEDKDPESLLEKEIEKEEYNNKDYEEEKQTQNTCNNGCLLNEICYPLGHRIDGTFCSNNLSLISQLGEAEKCDNNFECESNVCVSGECIDSGFIQKIMNWFKRFF